MTTCKLRFQSFSYRFAEQVLNSKLALKQEIEEILSEKILDINALSRPAFNKLLDERFTAKGWTRQPPIFDEPDDPGAKIGLSERKNWNRSGIRALLFLGN